MFGINKLKKRLIADAEDIKYGIYKTIKNQFDLFADKADLLHQRMSLLEQESIGQVHLNRATTKRIEDLENEIAKLKTQINDQGTLYSLLQNRVN